MNISPTIHGIIDRVSVSDFRDALYKAFGTWGFSVEETPNICSQQRFLEDEFPTGIYSFQLSPDSIIELLDPEIEEKLFKITLYLEVSNVATSPYAFHISPSYDYDLVYHRGKQALGNYFYSRIGRALETFGGRIALALEEIRGPAGSLYSFPQTAQNRFTLEAQIGPVSLSRALAEPSDPKSAYRLFLKQLDIFVEHLSFRSKRKIVFRNGSCFVAELPILASRSPTDLRFYSTSEESELRSTSSIPNFVSVDFLIGDDSDVRGEYADVSIVFTLSGSDLSIGETFVLTSLADYELDFYLERCPFLAEFKVF